MGVTQCKALSREKAQRKKNKKYIYKWGPLRKRA
jgi:hypothetical protein